MGKARSVFPYRLGVWPREFHAEGYSADHPLQSVFWLASLREARVYRLSPTLWRFRTDDGALDIVTAYPERLTWNDFEFGTSSVPTKLPHRMTRRAMLDTKGARLI